METGAIGTREQHAYDGTEVFADLDASSAVAVRYLRGDGAEQLFGRLAADGSALWYLTDRLGSVIALVNDSGTVVGRLGYTGFGGDMVSGAVDRHRYTGRELDAATGLQYHRARGGTTPRRVAGSARTLSASPAATPTCTATLAIARPTRPTRVATCRCWSQVGSGSSAAA